MILVDKPVVKSDCYNDGRNINPSGIMIHSVGRNQPDPNVFFNNWNKPDAGACVHAVIGADGTVLQLLPWTKRAWHCGSKANDTHIGIEMTEPSTIKYTGGGSNWKETSDGVNTKKHVLATYDYAVELFAVLCNEFKLNPLKDGVIISHAEGFKRGVASNHGDPEHIWSKFGITMSKFKEDIAIKMKGEVIPDKGDIGVSGMPIMGSPFISEKSCTDCMKSHGVSQKFLDLVPIYWSEGIAEGVRSDIALAQSCLETGWFTFKGDVSESQNNYSGLGATGNGVKGNEFDTPTLGIRAQIQHLKAYASTDALNGVCVDKRFDYVKRGSARVVEHLSIPNNPDKTGWAADKDYAPKILNILNEFSSFKSNSTDKVMYYVRKNWNDKKSQLGAYEVLSNARDMANLNPGYKVFDSSGNIISNGVSAPSFDNYMVSVTASSLNVREKPYANAHINEVVKRGDAFTIVAESGEWGMLKSGAGWINLKFTSRV